MEQMVIIQNMLDQAKKYNLEMECIISMISHIANVSDEELSQACENALGEWDI